jgi:hypothetical protein
MEQSRSLRRARRPATLSVPFVFSRVYRPEGTLASCACPKRTLCWLGSYRDAASSCFSRHSLSLRSKRMGKIRLRCRSAAVPRASTTFRLQAFCPCCRSHSLCHRGSPHSRSKNQRRNSLRNNTPNNGRRPLRRQAAKLGSDVRRQGGAGNARRNYERYMVLAREAMSRWRIAINTPSTTTG